MSFENIRFGGSGLLQSNFAGLDSSRISGVSQLSIPVTTALALGSSWRVDVTTLWASATLSYRDAAKASDTRTAVLSGISDIRVRATGTLISDVLVVTAGLNVPTGLTNLTTNEFAVLRIVASPSLGMGSTPVGAGTSGTLGLVAAHRLGPWAMAMGGSYERRGTYQPVAALVAGAPSADFQPGGVLRASLTGDRTVGPHRLSVAVAADVFSDDKLSSPPSSAAGATAQPSTSTTVRLGPVLSTDAQMQFSVPRLRQLIGYMSFRYRAPFSQDGNVVANSDGQYLDAGVRAVLGAGPHRDLILGADTRLHSGLGVDEGLPTSGVASLGLSAGVEMRRGLLSVQPYLRGQGGVLHQRGVGSSAPSQSFTGFALGLVALTKF